MADATSSIMEFDPAIEGLYETANLLPSSAVAALVDRLSALLNRRAGNPDLELGDMELDDRL